jgi:hypothetical protein
MCGRFNFARVAVGGKLTLLRSNSDAPKTIRHERFSSAAERSTAVLCESTSASKRFWREPERSAA